MLAQAAVVVGALAYYRYRQRQPVRSQVVYFRPYDGIVPGLRPLRADQPPPDQIPVGGCDEYEGQNGSLWICCEPEKGKYKCYKVVHQDPWHMTKRLDFTSLPTYRIDPRRFGITTRLEAGRECKITSDYNGQLYICCNGHCAPLPISVGELPVPVRQRLNLRSRGGTVMTPGCHVYALGPVGQLYMCCDDVCVPLPIVFGPLP